MSLPKAKPSTRKNKKIMITDKCENTIHAGYKSMSDFTKHNDK